MRPGSNPSRLRPIAQPSLTCLIIRAATEYLQTTASVADRQIPQTPIAFQAWRVDLTCTITHRLLLMGSTVILCPTHVRTPRSALVRRVVDSSSRRLKPLMARQSRARGETESGPRMCTVCAVYGHVCARTGAHIRIYVLSPEVTQNGEKVCPTSVCEKSGKVESGYVRG